MIARYVNDTSSARSDPCSTPAVHDAAIDVEGARHPDVDQLGGQRILRFSDDLHHEAVVERMLEVEVDHRVDADP